ncbi:MAG: tetratricopeptide repeat protein [Candidatus Acidiferrales bacterium]
MTRPIAVPSLLLMFLVSYPITTFGQQGSLAGNRVALTGTVYTEKGDHPIMHANVRLCDGGGNLLEESITADSGDFAFRGISRGNYILQVSAVGFQSSSTSLDLSFNSDRGIPIYLKKTALDASESAAPANISAHEMSMPKSARDLLISGEKKFYRDKNTEGGMADFRSAIAAAPGYYEAYYQIALADVTLGKKPEAEASLRKSIEVSRDSYGEADVGLGTMMLERGEIAQGEKAVRRGIELSPNYWLGHYELGRALFTENKLPDALKSAEQAKSLAPSAPIVYRLLSNIHLQQKDYPALLADIDAYLELDPDSPAGIRAKQLRKLVVQKVGSAKTTPAAAQKP